MNLVAPNHPSARIDRLRWSTNRCSLKSPPSRLVFPGDALGATDDRASHRLDGSDFYIDHLHDGCSAAPKHRSHRTRTTGRVPYLFAISTKHSALLCDLAAQCFTTRSELVGGVVVSNVKRCDPGCAVGQ